MDERKPEDIKEIISSNFLQLTRLDIAIPGHSFFDKFANGKHFSDVRDEVSILINEVLDGN